MSRQTQAIIHADAILHNFTHLASLASQSQTLAVIKADAYGHGAVNVARILRDKAPCFAVAIIEEALALRDAGISAPIVVLEGPHQARECKLARQNSCILVVHSQHQLDWLEECPVEQRPQLWLKVDTGMHRLGFHPDEVPALLQQHAALFHPSSVLLTHFACADEPDSEFTRDQLARFNALAEQVNMPVSLANSPATLTCPQSHGVWNRVGLALYGGSPVEGRVAASLNLRPAMTLKAAVLSVRKVPKGEGAGYGQTFIAERDSILATVGIGYADGYPRHCPNGTPVAVNGEVAALAGRVSMDMITVDVTDIGPVKPGDSVELWGNQISIDDVAAHAGTIAYELMTRVSARVPRIVRHV